MRRTCHLIIACGGTGGHFYPTFSVARRFCEYFRQDPEWGGAKATFLVSGKHAAEQKRIVESNGFDARIVDAVRLPGSPLGLPGFAWRFWRCRRQAGRILRELDGDVMLSMGSYAAAPASHAWPSGRRPLVLHEGNTVMGRANRWMVSHACGMALTLPLADPAQLKGRPSRITGMPLREELLAGACEAPSESAREALCADFGLDPSRRTVLAFGGSQGAQAINRLLQESAAKLRDFSGRLQFIILTGQTDNQQMQSAFEQAGILARICQSDPEIGKCYGLADLVICRGGASSLCEIALFGKPMVIIPLPSAADNHQYYNAMAFVQANAARLLPQSEANAERLRQLLADWLDDPGRWRQMGGNARKLACPDATDRVARMLVDAVKDNAGQR